MPIENILSKLPKVFGTTPEVYRGLLDAPERASLENRANIGGLLGFAAALAQGMSPQGYRRSAAQNILTALGAGYGAAGQTYDAGLNQISNVMKLAQAKRQISGLATLKAAHPDLAYLADVSPDEFVRIVSARERAKMYGLTPSAAPVVPSDVSSVSSVEVSPATEQVAPVGLISADSGGFPVSGGYGSLGVPMQAAPRVFDDSKPFAISSGLPAQVAPAQAAPAPAQVAPAPAASVPAPSAAPTQLVSPQDQAKADLLYQQALTADLLGDKAAADEFRRRAEILSPKEQFIFRDGILVSTKKGKIAQYLQTETLNPEQAAKYGLPTDKGQIWQREPSGKISRIEGTESTQLDKAQLIKTLPGQFANIHPTLQNRVRSLIARAETLTRDQINKETEAILDADSKILAELNPALQAAKKATAPNLTVTLTDPAKRAQALSENSSKYIQNKNVAESFEVATRFNNFVQAFNNPQAAGASDAVLIYSMAKMLDPGGAVQQGDIGTIAGQKSIPDKLKSIHQQFINSRTLSDAQREDLNAMAYSLMNVKRKALEPVVKQYRNYATALQSPDPTADVQNPFDNVILPKERVVTINQKRAKVRLGLNKQTGEQGYFYTAPDGKTYPYQD